MTPILMICTVVWHSGSAQPDLPAGPAAGPFPATLVSKPLSDAAIGEVLQLAAKEAGLTLERSKTERPVKWKPEWQKLPFWTVLDSYARETGQKIVVDGKGDRVHLMPSKELTPSDVTGPFRFAVRQIQGTIDFESGRRDHEVTLDFHFEPRLPVYRISKLRVTDAKLIAETGGRPFALTATTNPSKINIEGSRVPLSVRLAGIRERGRIALTGSVTVTAAEKLLTFRFPDLKSDAPQPRDRVTVSLVKFEKEDDDLWLARIELRYPPGGPEFESFEAESWLRDNRGALIAPTTQKRILPVELSTRITSNGAVIDYRFKDDPKPNATFSGRTGWILEITTPAPLVEFAVPFAIKEIPVP